MPELLLTEKSRKKIAGFLKNKERPRQINPETWQQLLHAELSSIPLNDLHELQYCFPRTWAVFLLSGNE